MKDPTNIISGRKYSNDPSLGIPIALKVLNDLESHRDDRLSATCYMGYRVIEGKYADIDYVWSHIQHSLEAVNTFLDTEPLWFKTRWQVSITLLSVYFETSVLKRPLNVKLLQSLCKEEHILNHPPQMVNIIRSQVLLVADKFFKNSNLSVNGRHSIINKSLSIIDLYRLAQRQYKIIQHKEHVFIYESGEAMEALTTLLELKFSINPDTSYPLNCIMDKWKKDIESGLSNQAYRKTLIQICNNYGVS
jgi:hypothetical protein